MRILVLHSRYASGPSSGENRVVDDEVRLLLSRGHDVAVWSPEAGGSGLGDQARMAVTAIWSRSATHAVRDLVTRGDFDVVHVHNLFPMLSPAVLRLSGAPTVMTLHNYRLLCLPATFLREGRTCESCLGRSPVRGVLHRCYRDSLLGSATLAASLTVHRAAATLGRVSTYLAVSDFVKAKHVEAGWPANRIAVKPNFAWPSQPRSGPGEDFLYLGRLSVEKGLSGLIEAWRMVPTRLHVVGEGPERLALERIAGANVVFHGAVEPGEVGRYLSRARALVLPSICYEGAPRTVVEAFAAGVPVVASRRGALPAIVEDGVSGLIVDLDDRTGWSNAAERLSDDSESIRLGQGALSAWRARYSPERSAESLEAVYGAAIEWQSGGRFGVSDTLADLTARETSRISQGTR